MITKPQNELQAQPRKDQGVLAQLVEQFLCKEKVKSSNLLDSKSFITEYAVATRTIQICPCSSRRRVPVLYSGDATASVVGGSITGIPFIGEKTYLLSRRASCVSSNLTIPIFASVAKSGLMQFPLKEKITGSNPVRSNFTYAVIAQRIVRRVSTSSGVGSTPTYGYPKLAQRTEYGGADAGCQRFDSSIWVHLFRDGREAMQSAVNRYQVGALPTPGAISSLVGRPDDVEGYIRQHLTYVLDDCKSGMSLYDVYSLVVKQKFVGLLSRVRFSLYIPILNMIKCKCSNLKVPAPFLRLAKCQMSPSADIWKSGRARLIAIVLKTIGSVNIQAPSVQIGSFPPFCPGAPTVERFRLRRNGLVFESPAGYILLYPNAEELISKISSCQLMPD
jgi:hypothetical protein